jgi:hypothetical protein
MNSKSKCSKMLSFLRINWWYWVSFRSFYKAIMVYPTNIVFQFHALRFSWLRFWTVLLSIQLMEISISLCLFWIDTVLLQYFWYSLLNRFKNHYLNQPPTAKVSIVLCILEYDWFEYDFQNYIPWVLWFDKEYFWL